MPKASLRVLAYLVATPLLVVLAWSVGVRHFEATECSGPDFGGECDLASLEGMLGTLGAIVLAAAAVETVLWRRRRRQLRDLATG